MGSDHYHSTIRHSSKHATPAMRMSTENQHPTTASPARDTGGTQQDQAQLPESNIIDTFLLYSLIHSVHESAVSSPGRPCPHGLNARTPLLPPAPAPAGTRGLRRCTLNGQITRCKVATNAADSIVVPGRAHWPSFLSSAEGSTADADDMQRAKEVVNDDFFFRIFACASAPCACIRPCFPDS